MKRKSKNKLICLFTLSLLLFLSFNSISGQESSVIQPSKVVKIAVVTEGESERIQIIEAIKPDLQHMLGNDYQVIFEITDLYNAKWDVNKIRDVLNAANEDPQIDIIVGIGRVIAQEAVKENLVFNKPFVGTSLLNGVLPQIPIKNGYIINKKNVSLILLPLTFDDDISEFSLMGKFDTIHVGINKFEYDNISNKKKTIKQLSEFYNIEIILLPLAGELKSAISTIDTTVKAFYLIELPQFTKSERKHLIAYLNSKKIYTFSNQGPSDLNMGALATNKPDINQEIERRLALNLFHLIEGQSTKDLSATLIVDPKLTINAKTGIEVGFNPSFLHKVTANYVNFDAFEKESDLLTIPDLLAKVDSNNTSLSISRYQTEAKLRDEKIARSALLPQIGVGASYEKTHNQNLNGLIPEEQTLLGVSVNQMIYDDEFISGFRASKRLAKAASYQSEVDKLNLYYDAEKIYFAYSQAKILLKIALDNLRLTEGNLDLAKMRVAVGQSGKDEVYRWQVELANRRTDVLNAEASEEAQRIALNQVLGMPQDIIWNPEDINVNENYLYENYKILPLIFDSPDLFEKFRIVTVEMAKENSPELKLIKQNIEAQEIVVGQKKRSYFLPKFGASFEYAHIFSQSESILKIPEDNNKLSLSAYLPIFEGTRKIYSNQKEEIILNELEERALLIDERVEQRTRTALRILESSYPTLKFSSDAAENAKLNLMVIRDKYANGIVNITQLLDAQNASFRAEQNATIAKYNFLSDLVELQRATSIFFDSLTNDEKDDLVNFIDEKMKINN